MSEPVIQKGGCLCGAVRFEFPRSALVSAHHCHCKDCQRCTGSGFATICFLPESAFQKTGEVGSFEVETESGNSVTRSFCTTCGSQLFSHASMVPGLVFVKAGVLDEADWFEINSSFWSVSAQPWATPDASHPVHERNPG